MSKIERPSGIIRTLPNLKADKDRIAYGRMTASLKSLKVGLIDTIYIALAQKPKDDILHIYLLIEGKIVCRMNIAGYVSGADNYVKCWDEVSRQPKWWALCTAPLEYPPDEIRMRGFQGFRYTEELW